MTSEKGVSVFEKNRYCAIILVPMEIHAQDHCQKNSCLFSEKKIILYGEKITGILTSIEKKFLVHGRVKKIFVPIPSHPHTTSKFHPLRWLKTVSSTFQDVDFDGSLLPLFIS